MTNNRYLIIGSAPYIKDYWPVVREYYLDNGYRLIGINNVWKFLEETTPNFEWFFPADFMGRGPISPTKADLRWLRGQPIGWFLEAGRIRGYKSKVSGKSGTMSLNVLHTLFNRHEHDPDLQVVITGSDMQYPPGKTAFYGEALVGSTGKPDPLRLGEDWVVEELQHVQDRYEQQGFELYVDTPGITLLPFPHIRKQAYDCQDNVLDLRESLQLPAEPGTDKYRHGLIFQYMKVQLASGSLDHMTSVDSSKFLMMVRSLILPGGALHIQPGDGQTQVAAESCGYQVVEGEPITMRFTAGA